MAKKMTQASEIPNLPVDTVRYGSLRAAIWKNPSKKMESYRPRYNVTVTRVWRDGDQWRESARFGYDDLLLLGKILDECHTRIHDMMKKEAEDQRSKH